ncbi:yeats family-domain-containing protein [Chytriomyces cf. hyalinus JEL632]|nr:yeats family-domain-containing protein [Chytriomyces cf. hyalinus JEL632]
MARRLKNEQFCCPIIFGSVAGRIGKKDPPPSDPSHTHRWTVFVRGANGEDISPIIKRVSFKLHESFVPPVRVIESPPFEVTETGWGEFEILIKLSFADSQEKPLPLFHQLQLYPKDKDPDPDAEYAKLPITSEHYEEIVFNEPHEEFIEPLRRYRAQVIANPGKSVSSTFTPQLEASETKRLYSINDKVLADIEKWKSKLAASEHAKKKLENDIRSLEAEAV